MICFHPFQGRPLFGPEDIATVAKELRISFHPFQGRPLFGRAGGGWCVEPLELEFPSLSGKTSIRTVAKGQKTKPAVSVSIPFREDLYSDKNVGIQGSG